MIDTADAYNDGTNEELVGRALSGRRDRAVLATKFGNIRLPDGTRTVNGRPDYVIEACEKSLKRLGVEAIALFYQHRIDKIGRAHVCTPVINAHLVCRILLEQ